MKETIYKKDSKGKLRFLTIETDKDLLVQTSGLVTSAKPIRHVKACVGKNTGKTNASTPEQQAELEAKAMVAIKLSEDYYPSIAEALDGVKIFPMLAKKFEDEEKKVNWGSDSFQQPKLDGMRNFYIREEGQSRMQSRDGKLIVTMDHIKDELDNILSDTPNIILDGELYGHKLNFQENMRLIKKKRPESINIKYHIYDTVSNMPFTWRNAKIKRLFLIANKKFNAEHIVMVPTYIVADKEEAQSNHALFLEEGYEGSIIRHGADGYKLNGRSSSLLKMKDFDDVALTLIDVTPAEARPDWGVPLFELNGKKFNAGVRLSHEERTNLLKNKEEFIGQTAEVRYFGLSEEGIPRFPVLVGFRLDK